MNYKKINKIFTKKKIGYMLKNIKKKNILKCKI